MILAYTPDLDFKTIIPCYNKRWHEKYIWAIHSIVFQQLRNKNTFNGYVNLDSDLLKKYLGTDFYKSILSQLMNAKIIEPMLNSKGVQTYSKGAFSKAYRINPELLNNNRIKAIPINKKTYERKITNVRSQLIKEAIKLNPNIQHELLQLTYRRIKYDEALNYINTNYEPHTPQYKARLIALNEFNEMHKASFSQGKEVINFHFSYNKGRVYSPASMLPRDLEQFTYFKNYDEPSLCLDLPNSQLCFFDELVKRNTYKKVEHIGREEREIDKEREERPFNPKNKEKLSLPHTHSLCVRDLTTWQNYIYKGKGYERIMHLAKWNNKSEGHTKDERQQFKEVFFGELFYNRYIPNYLTHLEKVFSESHPNEANNLRTIKKQLGNKLLAVEVQKLEGKFFHNICVTHIKTNYRDIPFTIKHDSITLPRSCASFLIDELNKLIHEFFNTTELNFKVDEL